jgi:hypothetical protein
MKMRLTLTDLQFQFSYGWAEMAGPLEDMKINMTSYYLDLSFIIRIAFSTAYISSCCQSFSISIRSKRQEASYIFSFLGTQHDHGNHLPW